MAKHRVAEMNDERTCVTTTLHFAIFAFRHRTADVMA